MFPQLTLAVQSHVSLISVVLMQGQGPLEISHLDLTPTYVRVSGTHVNANAIANANPPRSSELMITGRSDNVSCATRLCICYVDCYVGKVQVQPWHARKKK